MIERTKLQQAADGFDSINVDGDGLCMWTDVANALGNLRRVISHHAPPSPPCVLSTETKEALGVAIAFFDGAIRRKNEALAESERLGQERITRNLFSQRNSLERHQLLIQQIVTGHPSRSAASTVEPVAYVPLSKSPNNPGEPVWREAFPAEWIDTGSVRWQGYELKAVYFAAPATSTEPDSVRADRWSDALSAINSISANPARAGQHLDIRIVGPGCSVTLLELDSFRELVARARLAAPLSRNQGQGGGPRS